MAENKQDTTKNEGKKEEKKQRSRIMQTDIPAYTLEETIKVPQAISDNFAGKGASPIQVAVALDVSPSSTNFRYLTGAAVAYGLTNGAYNANDIALTDIGKRIVAPTVEDDDKIAIIQAILTPTLLNKFYTTYNNAKMPKDNIAHNVLADWGVPKDKAPQTFDLIKKNGEFARIITDTKSGQYITLDKCNNTTNNITPILFADEQNLFEEEQDELPEELVTKLNIKSEITKSELEAAPVPTIPKVFISHGKNKKMVENLKELLLYGQFEPIVSVERESTAIPVPDKVFADMKTCNAGIIHIEEEILLDKEGNQKPIINSNVLIEIGAAIAFYGKKVILLCQKGITLPSNLQGLYRCEYEGDHLDYSATMKLLKTFTEIRK